MAQTPSISSGAFPVYGQATSAPTPFMVVPGGGVTGPPELFPSASPPHMVTVVTVEFPITSVFGEAIVLVGVVLLVAAAFYGFTRKKTARSIV